MGFVLDPDQARELIEQGATNKEVIYPFLNGEDVNSGPYQSPSRCVINFFDWPLGRVNQNLPRGDERILDAVRHANSYRTDTKLADADSSWPSSAADRREKWLQTGLVPNDYPHPVAADYPECLEIVDQHVRPERQRPSERGPDRTGRNFQLRPPLAERYWTFGEKRPELYRRIRQLGRCLVRSAVSAHHNFAWLPTDIVFSHATIIIASDRDAMFAIVQSSIHQAWTEQNASSMRTDTRYTPSDCFETFPLPPLTERMDDTGRELDATRAACCKEFQKGLTEVAKMTHDPNCKHPLVEAYRKAIIANDFAVLESYGWEIPDLNHDFYGEGRDRRFTISPTARQEILRRLLKLNKERYEEEVAAGLHQKGKSKAKKHPHQPFGPRQHLFDDQGVLGETDQSET